MKPFEGGGGMSGQALGSAQPYTMSRLEGAQNSPLDWNNLQSGLLTLSPVANFLGFLGVAEDSNSNLIKENTKQVGSSPSEGSNHINPGVEPLVLAAQLTGKIKSQKNNPVTDFLSGAGQNLSNVIDSTTTQVGSRTSNAMNHIKGALQPSVEAAEFRHDLNSPQNTLFGVAGAFIDEVIATGARASRPPKPGGSISTPPPPPPPPKQYKLVIEDLPIDSEKRYGTIKKMMEKTSSSKAIPTILRSLGIFALNGFRHVATIATKSIKAPLYMGVGTVAGIGWLLLAMATEKGEDGKASNNAMDILGKVALLVIPGVVLAYEAAVTTIMTPLLLFVGYRFGLDYKLDPLEQLTEKLEVSIYKMVLGESSSGVCHYLTPLRCHETLIKECEDQLNKIGKETKTPLLMQTFIEKVMKEKEDSLKLFALIQLRNQYQKAITAYQDMQNSIDTNDTVKEMERLGIKDDEFVKRRQEPVG